MRQTPRDDRNMVGISGFLTGDLRGQWIAADPGTVEVIDLRSLKTVATVDVAPQAGGIDFWKMEGK